MIDVLVIGGGNAALCAALMAREAGASVLLLESAPREWRGGNSQHTRNLRCMHDAPQDVLVDAYPEEEFWQDLLKVTGGATNEKLARLVDPRVVDLPPVDAQARRALPAVAVGRAAPGPHQRLLHGRRQGAGQCVLPQRRERWACEIRYDAPVDRARIATTAASSPRTCGGERIEARACVLAAGGFESNREWLREAWGQNERGEWPADNFLIRGTRFNMGVLLRFMIDAGRRYDRRSDAGAHASRSTRARRCTTAASARASTACRWAWWSIATRSASTTRARTSGPSATRSGGASSRSSRGRSRYSIIDAKAVGRFMPPVFPGDAGGDACRNWRARSGCPKSAFMQTINAYNAACRVGTFDHTVARRLPHRRPRAGQDALGAARSTRRRSTAMRCGRASRSRTSASRSTRRAAVHFGGQPSAEPVRRRRDDGRQRAGQGLYRGRRHEHRHGIRPHRRHTGRAGARAKERCACAA